MHVKIPTNFSQLIIIQNKHMRERRQLKSVLQKDHEHYWHPCSQMKDYETFKPLMIKKARGSILTLDDGRELIDANSSWWCKSLGHNHPRLKQAAIEQINQFEHVIQANTTNETIVALSEKLSHLTKTLKKVFYAGDGSCAVEVAMKMSLHSRKILGENQRTKFIALENGYHGETLATMSISDVGLYKKPYKSALFDVEYLKPIPYVSGGTDPIWQNCNTHWKKIKPQLEKYKDTATAIILEPILQGACGMLVYSKDLLKKLRAWCNENNVHLIADEIMTGIGRTGRMLACEHAGIEPDFACISKGLTSGWVAFSAVLTRNDIYEIFYDDYETGKAFLHSHTFSGNPLGARIALETLRVFEEENILQRANTLSEYLLNKMQEVANQTGKMTNTRHIGCMVAADIVCANPKERLGYKIYQKATELGALLRPLGNTIYWLPPLNTENEIIDILADITAQAIISC